MSPSHTLPGSFRGETSAGAPPGEEMAGPGGDRLEGNENREAPTE